MNISHQLLKLTVQQRPPLQIFLLPG